MTGAAEVWHALDDLRSRHRELGCRRVTCAIDALDDEDLEEIVQAIRQDDLARMRQGRPLLDVVPTGPIAVAVAGHGEVSAAGGTRERGRRFRVGDRVVYDLDAQINEDLGAEYQHFGVCTVTALDGEEDGQFLSFVDEHGNIHDGWWADRFTFAVAEAAPAIGEGDVTYFVAFQSAAGFGSRVLGRRRRLVTAADVVELTDALASEVGTAVVPLNWIELPATPSIAPVAVPLTSETSGGAGETWSALATIPLGGANASGLNGSGHALTSGAMPLRAASPDDRPAVPYLPRRAM